MFKKLIIISLAFDSKVLTKRTDALLPEKKRIREFDSDSSESF